MRIYINGTEDTTRVNENTLGDAISVNNFLIGKLVSGSNYFNGSISDVKIWNTALSESNIRSQYLKPESVQNQSNLKAWYPMCEGLAQSVAYDHSGNNNHAVENGAYTLAVAQNEPLIPQVPLMKYNEKMVFSDANYVNCGTLLGNDLSGGLTISLWFNATAMATNNGLFSFNSGLEIASIFENNKIAFYLNGAKWSESSTITLGKTYHVVFSLDASNPPDSHANSGIYINGVKDSTGTATNFPAADVLDLASLPFIIGRYYSDAFSHDGLIDDVSMFNTAFNATQVQEIFNDGVALDATTHSKSGNLLGYWRNDGVTTWQDRRGWSYLDFDGSNDEVTLDSELTFSGVFSVSFWVKHNSSGAEYVIGKSSGDQDFFYAHPTNPRWKINNVIASSNTAMAVGVWHHVLGVRDSSNVLKWYLNGSAGALWTGSAYLTTGVTRSGDFDINYFGRSSSNYGEIELANVAFFNTDKSSSASTFYNNGLSYDYTTESGITNYYKMDSSSTLLDRVGSVNGTVDATLNTGNDGDVQGSPNSVTIREGLTSGKDGLNFPLKNADSNVVRFDSSVESEKIIIPAMPFEYRTISFWFKTNKDFTSSSTKMPFLDIEDTTYAGLFIGSLTTSNLGSGSSNELFIISGDSGNTGYEDNTNTIYANTWYHLALIWDDANSYYKFYLDTVAKTSDTTSNHFDLQSNKRIQIGRRNFSDSSSYFDGMIDEVKIYNKSLSPSELSKNYKHGKGKHKND